MQTVGFRQLLIISALFTILPSDALAGLCFPPDAKPDSAYHYLLALVDAYGYAKSARDRATAQPTNPSDFLTSAVEQMTNLKLADRDYACAASIVKAYASSPKKPIATSALAATTVFEALVEFDKRVASFYKRVVNADPETAKLGDLAERAAEFGVQADDIWKALPLATIAATYAVIEVNPSEQVVSRFTITANQRSEILAKLTATFGPSIQQGMQAGQLPLEVAAGGLYGFLNDRKWRSKDDV